MATKLHIDKTNYKHWVRRMYYRNCAELESYGQAPYKNVREYEKKNQKFLTAKYLKEISKV